VSGCRTAAEYEENLVAIREMIKGNFSGVMKELKEKMEKHAKAYEFEKAQAVKEKIILLERYQAKSTIVNPKLGELDVFTIIDSEEAAYVNFLKVAHGAIIQAYTVEIRKKLEETPAELLSLAVFDLRRRLASEAREILVPFPNWSWSCPAWSLQCLKSVIRNIYWICRKEMQSTISSKKKSSSNCWNLSGRASES
jgi:excinuclease ABC subunit C